jgi:hypothetical protein
MNVKKQTVKYTEILTVRDQFCQSVSRLHQSDLRCNTYKRVVGVVAGNWQTNIASSSSIFQVLDIVDPSLLGFVCHALEKTCEMLSSYNAQFREN